MTSLTTVTADDWTILRAIARRVLSARGPEPFRHPSCDRYWQVERSAIRLSGYVSNGEMTIDIVVPGTRAPDDDLELDADVTVPDVDRDVLVRLSFDDGLEPILVPWQELELVMEPAPRRR